MTDYMRSPVFTVLLRMYAGDGSQGSGLKRDGLRDLLLDIIAAEAPAALGSDTAATHTKAAAVRPAVQPLAEAMTDAAMVQFDADADSVLNDAEWSAFVANEAAGVLKLMQSICAAGPLLYGEALS
jgi:hypothetical protein